MPTDALAQEVATGRPFGELEPVAYFDGAMLTGVTVSQQGRVFVNFPEWGDDVDFTVAEIRDGRPVAYPDEATNRTGPDDPGAALVSVQSVVVDPADRRVGGSMRDVVGWVDSGEQRAVEELLLDLGEPDAHAAFVAADSAEPWLRPGAASPANEKLRRTGSSRGAGTDNGVPS